MCYNRLMIYAWQHQNWPNFNYDLMSIMAEINQFHEKAGRITGIVESLPEGMRMQAILDTMVSEAIKTSEIEGEYISREDVMSSIRNTLGLNADRIHIRDKRANGIGQMMVHVRENYESPLDKTTLFDWHTMLMSGNRYINAGAWRTHSEPMQVVSGPIGKETIHFEAPPSEKVAVLMRDFIAWFNKTSPEGDTPIIHAPIRAGLAHLYFETIHPFEDGNGRIGRAISEKALSQGLGRPAILSLSYAIEAKKNDYYEALKSAQRTLNVTPWLEYFMKTCLAAQNEVERRIDFVLAKTKYFDRYTSQLNERQTKVIRRMLDEGLDGFKGGMSAKKYISITHTSKATATRDLQELLDIGAMHVTGGGRSTRYWLSL